MPGRTKPARHGRMSLLALCLALAVAGDASAQDGGYSAWNIQGLYGTSFDEPFNPESVGKVTFTLENSAGWDWGSSYMFVDALYSTRNDDSAKEIYGEWYPSASVAKMSGKDLSAGIFKDISLTMGLNAGRKTTGASPLVFLPGVTVDLKLPGFAFASLGLYAYIDDGKLDGESNGCHATGYQVTPSWLLPFSIGKSDWQFGGFGDYISSHGGCAEQFLSQIQLTMDVGKAAGSAPGKLYAGMEYLYWNNKFGIDGVNDSTPQFLFIYKF